MKKLFHILFAVIISIIINSCSKDESSEYDDPLDIRENVLVKKITKTNALGNVQTIDFIYDGNKIVSLETDEEIHSFFYTGNLITRREVFNKEFSITEITNYTYNGKVLKTSNNITFVNNNSESMTFNAPDETNTTPSSSNLYKYRGYIDFEQNLVYEYITIFETYDLILYGPNRAATIEQNNYRYTYDDSKNPFNNIIGMGYLLNNDNRLRFGVLHLLNGNCKKNINKVEAYSFLTFWGNPTSVTDVGPVYTYDRVYTYNDLNYPTEISEKVFKNSSGNTTLIADNIVYTYQYY
jgi:uncharacterized lipoprotein YehR (DUF1307 family)